MSPNLIRLLLALLAALAFARPAAAQDGDGDEAPRPASPTARYKHIPTRTAIPAPASFFAVQAVLPTSAVIVIAGEAATRTVDVSWRAEPAPPPGPEGAPGVVRTHAQAAAPSGTARAEVVRKGRTAEARLGPLEADTGYRYTVASGGASLYEGTFRTAPPPGKRAIVFAAVGDTGENPEEYLGAPVSAKREVMDAVQGARPEPELLLHLGDIVYPDGSWLFYRLLFFGPMQPLMGNIPIFPALGNHDCKADGGQTCLDVFATPANNPERSERYYSFDWGDVHFIALDNVSQPLDPASPQLVWLEKDLAASKAAWKVAYFHVPPYSDAAHGDNPVVERAFVPIFERGKLDVCLAGHEHCYERLKPINGVLYLVAGGGGARVYPIKPSPRLVAGASVHSFVRGRADAHRLTFEAIDTAGKVLDAVSLER